MKIKEILGYCKTPFLVRNLKNINVKGIAFNSEDIQSNYIFAAIKGIKKNGEDFIDDVSNINNVIILTSLNITKINNKLTMFLQTQSVRELMGEISSILYPNSISDKIAITGTNGKTSIAHYVSELSSKQFISNAIFGTLGVLFNKKIFAKTNLTTPDVITNHKILNKLNKKECERVIFEASSIGLHQKRLQNVYFDKLAFTNLTNDHLDYHKDFRNYKMSKSILFNENIKKSTIAVINTDDKYSKFFIKICEKNKIKILDYGKNAKYLKIIKTLKKTNIIETHIKLNHRRFCINFPCYTSYQVYNQICAFLLVFGKKLNKKRIIDNLNISDPDGRLEKIYDKNNIRVFIDYAHTPDALKQILSTLGNINGNLVIVFGCGGDRDIKKRPLMTKEAVKYCDYIFMTSDNPRTESPKKIFSDMTKKLKQKDLKKIEIIESRSKAIHAAIDFIKAGDTLIIAGKGHEKYQIINDKRIYFSDSEIATDKLLDK